MSAARGEMDALEKKHASASAQMQKLGGLGMAAVGGAAVAVGIASVKMAGDFQQNMSKLVTSGGEMKQNLSGDMSGVMKLMGQTGTSSEQLAAALYVINSAGFHARDGLVVLKAAAEGAKTENADVAVVTDGLTTLLNDYRLKAADAALVTSKMVEATAHGKTTFEALAGSLHTVSPIAHAVGLSMNEVLGAMATMTGEGTPAADAATYLRFAIGNLANPTKKARDEMKALGIDQLDLSQHLGQRGLTGTFNILTQAIATHVHGGLVLIDNLKQAAAAGSGWAVKLQEMTGAQQANIKSMASVGVSVDKLKTEQADGAKLTTKQKDAIREYTAEIARLPPAYRSVLAGVVANKLGFTDLQSTIAKLPPTEQTQVGALADMVGGTKGMQAALELTGANAQVFAANVRAVGKASTEAGGHVAGWATVQHNFNQKLAEAKGSAEALGISLGLKLIPIIEKAINFMTQHKQVVIDGLIAVTVGFGLMAAAATAAFVAENLATLGIVAGLVALGAAAVYLATHWHQVWSNIKQWFDDAVKFLRSGFGTLLVLLAGPLAPIALLALHWQQLWRGMETVIRSVVPPLMTWFRTLGDGFFNTIQSILSAGSHLPFVGKYFRQANDAVKAAHHDFDSELTGWANNARSMGNNIGGGFGAGMELALARSIPKVKGQADYMVAETAKSMRFTARISSPSKLTIPIGEGMADGIIKGIQNKMVATQQAAAAMIGGTAGLAGFGAGASTSGYAALGKQMAAQYGWTGAEWTALNNVAMRESGWNPNAQNPTSSAYGIAQNINGRAGYPDPSPAGQIAWMLAYIKSRYGDPIGAWNHEMSAGWYNSGGLLPPGLSLALNTTGHAEVVKPGTGGDGIVVNVYGSVVTEGQLVDAIHTGLLRKQQRTPLGLRS